MSNENRHPYAKTGLELIHGRTARDLKRACAQYGAPETTMFDYPPRILPIAIYNGVTGRWWHDFAEYEPRRISVTKHNTIAQNVEVFPASDDVWDANLCVWVRPEQLSALQPLGPLPSTQPTGAVAGRERTQGIASPLGAPPAWIGTPPFQGPPPDRGPGSCPAGAALMEAVHVQTVLIYVGRHPKPDDEQRTQAVVWTVTLALMALDKGLVPVTVTIGAPDLLALLTLARQCDYFWTVSSQPENVKLAPPEKQRVFTPEDLELNPEDIQRFRAHPWFQDTTDAFWDVLEQWFDVADEDDNEPGWTQDPPDLTDENEPGWTPAPKL